jgi:hypothetical protein
MVSCTLFLNELASLLFIKTTLEKIFIATFCLREGEIISRNLASSSCWSFVPYVVMMNSLMSSWYSGFIARAIMAVLALSTCSWNIWAFLPAD